MLALGLSFHGGGIAAAIDLETGTLGPATDLGRTADVGWVDHHPVTGERIAGRTLDWWPLLRSLAIEAHRAFADRLFIGWDIATGERTELLRHPKVDPAFVVDHVDRPGIAGAVYMHDGTSSLWIDAQSVSGSVTSDLDVADAPAGENGEQVDLRIRTVSGDVRISRSGAPVA